MTDHYLTVAVILLVLGVVLFVAEFAMQVGGWLAGGGGLLIGVAALLVWLYGSSTEKVVATIGVCVGLSAGGWVFFQGMKRMAVKSGLDPDAAGGSIITAVPELTELDAFKGQYGKTASPLRPAGTVVINGRRLDASSEGTLIPADTWVKCIDVRAGRLIVRESEAPTDLLAQLDLADKT